MATPEPNDLKITRRVGGHVIEVIGEWQLSGETFALRAYLDGELISTTNTDDLMTGDKGKPSAEHTAVLLVVSPAQTACFDPQQRVFVADLRQGEAMLHQVPGRLQHQATDTHPASLAGPARACI